MRKLPPKLKFLFRFFLVSTLLYFAWRYLGQYYYRLLQMAGNGLLALFSQSGRLVNASKIVAGGQEIIYVYEGGNIYQPLNLEVISLNLILYLSLLLASENISKLKNVFFRGGISLLVMFLSHLLIIVVNYRHAFAASSPLIMLLSLLNFNNGLFLPCVLWFWTCFVLTKNNI